MSWQENIDNLVRIGQLDKANYIKDEVEQYFKNTKSLLDDAVKVDSVSSRFLLAYEGMHSLCLAVLNKVGVRSGTGQGHRQVAFQTALLILNIDKIKSGASSTILNLHKKRNSDTYRSPFPPLTKAEADAAVKGLELMYEAASTFLFQDENHL